MQPHTLVPAGIKSALYSVMGYIPGVLRTLIKMVLPQPIDIKAGPVCTHIWHHLSIGRFCTHI